LFSYKRFVSGSWAPTKLAWSFDNRTSGFRVVGNGQSLRVTHCVNMKFRYLHETFLLM